MFTKKRNFVVTSIVALIVMKSIPRYHTMLNRSMIERLNYIFVHKESEFCHHRHGHPSSNEDVEQNPYSVHEKDD